jgi:hypothetical protein
MFGYGPATISDFCHWSELTKKRIGEAWPNEKLVYIDFSGRNYFLTHDDPDLHDSLLQDYPEDKVFLLGKFDPLFLSYHHKDWIISNEQRKLIWTSTGHVESVILSGTISNRDLETPFKGPSNDRSTFPFSKNFKKRTTANTRRS